MVSDVLSPADAAHAAAVWAEYQRAHDVSAHRGQAVGVDPLTGEVFLGGTMGELLDRLRAEGRGRPLVFWRVGFPYYAKDRGGRRWSAGG